MGKHRVEALSDGVFAVAMTLLVFGFRAGGISAAALRSTLLHLWPQLLAYILSFIIVGVYWVAHHTHFHFIARVNRTLLWFNNLFLMIVAFIPFPASLLGEYPDSQVSIVVYAGTLVCANTFLALTWFYASRAGLLHSGLPARFRRYTLRVTSAPILVYIAAIAVSFASRKISLALFAVVPAFFIIPHRLVADEVEKATNAQPVQPS